MELGEGQGLLVRMLREAEAELARLHAQRVDLDRGERLASERVTHLRALVELGAASQSETAPATNGDRRSESARNRDTADSLSGRLDRRPEDIAAEVLSELGPLHYRSLWEQVAKRGGVIVSGNPAAVLLTRISRDERFGKGKSRGVYRLVIGEEHQRPAIKRRRRKARRHSKPKNPATVE